MATTVTTLRMDDEILRTLRARAKREGRSVSSLISSILRRSVVDGDGKRSFVGALGNTEVPELEELRAVRSQLNAALRAKTKARRHGG